MRIIVCIMLVGLSAAVDVPVSRHCGKEIPSAGLAPNYYENVAHAIHSMSVQALRIFNPRATRDNHVPTVNLNISSPVKVVDYAPDDPIPSGEGMYYTPTMGRIDKILSLVGSANDGLGPSWSPVERVVHYFHMFDLWERIKLEYDQTVAYFHPDDYTCECLLDVHKNGVRNAVAWVSDHYGSGTPITLLNRPIPRLTDAKTWTVWKDRLLHYYTKPALQDAAKYIYCATRNF